MSADTPRNWGGFGAAITEAQAIAGAERERPLVDCPVCGELLDVNARGERNCPLGHFSAPAGAPRADYGAGL